MLTYQDAASLLDRARSRYDGKPLANNTRLHDRGDHLAVRLHATDIIRLYPDGSRALCSGGWNTVTTRARLREFTNAQLESERGTWYVRLRPATPEPPYPMGTRPVVDHVTYKHWQTGEDMTYPVYGRTVFTREERAQRKAWRLWREANRVPFHDGIRIDADGFAIAPKSNPNLAREWCKFHGLRVRNGRVTLYKAVNAELRSDHGTVYPVGATVVDSRYRPTRECGDGLHFGPTPEDAARYHYNSSAPTILRCSVPIESLIPLGDKCKARECKVLRVANRAVAAA